MICVEALVPPKSQKHWPGLHGPISELYTMTGARKDAVADVSAAERFRQPASCCHDGLAIFWLHALPVAPHGPPHESNVQSFHTVSFHPRFLCMSCTRCEPPTH